MKFSIHQPCYFPWFGLLHKIACSDVLIVLDEVQLSDSAFQHRNQFLTNDGKVKFLTIPFLKKNYLELSFKDLKISDSSWGVSHRNFLQNNYKKHDFFNEIYPKIEFIFFKDYIYLIDLIMDSMNVSMAMFGIQPKVMLQSETGYNVEAKKGDLVLQLLKATNAGHYLSGRGAISYQDDSIFKREGIVLEYVDYIHPVYQQKNSQEFISGLSCLDLLFNIGSDEASLLIKERSEA